MTRYDIITYCRDTPAAGLRYPHNAYCETPHEKNAQWEKGHQNLYLKQQEGYTDDPCYLMKTLPNKEYVDKRTQSLRND